jgi:hypothetical protein
VVVNTPDNTALVLTFDDPALPAIHDLTDSAPGLILLALSEPPAPSDVLVPVVTPGHVSLVTSASVVTGILEMADEDAQSRCFAAAINPFSGETDVLELATVLTLIAAGAAVQITSGWAATAARNLDEELEHLDDWR